MKKNKTIAYALAATLLVGGTFVGTKAWFTASGEVDSGLVVTTGTMGLKVTEEDNWTVTTLAGDKTEITNKDNSKNNFLNVKPGDTFKKEVTVENTGSLRQILEVSQAESTKTDNNFDVTIDGLDDLKNAELGKGESKKFTIKVATNVENMHSNDVDIEKDSSGTPIHDDEGKEFNLKNVMGQITINAKQTNAN